MNIKSILKPLLTSTLVLIVLSLISIIQYRWLISWAERDISELYRDLNFRVYRSLANEIEDEFILYKELYKTDIANEKEIKGLFETLYNDYIVESGFIWKNQIHTYNGKFWELKEDSLLNNQTQGILMPESGSNGLVKFMFPVHKGVGTKGFILFNILKFYTDKIENRDNFLDKGYKINWYFELPDGGVVLNDKRYKYSPMGVIFDRILNNEKEWFFSVNFFFELIKDRGREDFKFLIRPKPFLEHEKHLNIYFEILQEGVPVVKVKENYITILWLLTLILLIGLGVAYILIINQIRKLKELRRKEKVFVASVTHELRTPLAVIHSAADNILQGILSLERIVKYGDLIKDQSKRLSSMIEDILLFSRIEGKAEIPPELKTTSIDTLKKQLEVVKDSVKNEFECDVKLEISINEDFISDRDSLELILTNLITNAGKHGSSSSVRIKAHVNIPEEVVFIVEDDGPGLDKSEIKHIYEPFFRGKRSYGEQVKGSGLGLFLSKEKVKLIGGTLTVKSPYERSDGKKRSGAKFILTIPYLPVKKEGSNEKTIINRR